MRFATDRLTQLARTLPTAEHSKQDSQLEVLRSITPVIELPSILRTGQFKSTLVEQPTESFIYEQDGAIVGVSAAVNLDGPQLSPGLWHIQGNCRWQFAGTNNGGIFSAYQLLDANGTRWNLASWQHIQGSLVTPIDIVVSIGDVGWFFRQQRPATIAGDVLGLHGSLLVARLT